MSYGNAFIATLLIYHCLELG